MEHVDILARIGERTVRDDSIVYSNAHGADRDAADADGFYGEGDEIEGFEAVHVAGHRGHQHALVGEDRASGQAMAVLSDAVSGGGQGRFSAGRYHLPPAAYSEDVTCATRSPVKLRDYESEVGLVFHGSSLQEGASGERQEDVGP